MENQQTAAQPIMFLCGTRQNLYLQSYSYLS